MILIGWVAPFAFAFVVWSGMLHARISGLERRLRFETELRRYQYERLRKAHNRHVYEAHHEVLRPGRSRLRRRVRLLEAMLGVVTPGPLEQLTKREVPA